MIKHRSVCSRLSEELVRDITDHTFLFIVAASSLIVPLSIRVSARLSKTQYTDDKLTNYLLWPHLSRSAG